MHAQALEPDDMTDIKEMVDDYMDRNQDSFDEFSDPDQAYEVILEQLDGLEVFFCPWLLLSLPCNTFWRPMQ